MSISRRVFIKVASFAAIAAGTMAKPEIVAWAQGLQPETSDPLAYYTQATFTQYINSVFRLHGFVSVDVTLEAVEDALPSTVSRTGGRESFMLTFRGGGVSLPQNTYTVEHPALGMFQLFLVPGGANQNGAQSYVATINRLEYAAKPFKQPKAVPTNSAPKSNPKAEPSAPTVPKTPETKSPDLKEIPKSPGQPRPVKPSPELKPEIREQ